MVPKKEKREERRRKKKGKTFEVEGVASLVFCFALLCFRRLLRERERGSVSFLKVTLPFLVVVEAFFRFGTKFRGLFGRLGHSKFTSKANLFWLLARARECVPRPSFCQRREALLKMDMVLGQLMHDEKKTIVCFVLAVCYFIVAVSAVAQFIRTHKRLSKALTKQKLFFTFTALTALARLGLMLAVPFLNEPLLLSYYKRTYLTILNNLPGLLFFSTYNLLIAYWAEILDRVQNPAVRRSAVIHPFFIVANVLIYVAQIALWAIWATKSQPFSYKNPWTLWVLRSQLALFAVIYFFASMGFLFFGSRLVALLRRVENANGGQRGVYNNVVKRRLREVGVLTGICTTSFMLRTGMIIVFFVKLEEQKHSDATLGREGNLLYVVFYYIFSEVIPSCLLLYILRELPRRPQNRASTGLQSPNTLLPTQSRFGGPVEATPLLGEKSPSII